MPPPLPPNFATSAFRTATASAGTSGGARDHDQRRRRRREHRGGRTRMRGHAGGDRLQAGGVPAVHGPRDHDAAVRRARQTPPARRPRGVASCSWKPRAVRASALFSPCSRSMAGASSIGETDSRRLVAASASRHSRIRARARPPHWNSTRVPPLNFSQPVTAMMPMPPVRATWVPPHADRSKSVDLDEAQRAGAVRFLAQRQRGRLFGGDEPDLNRAILPDDAVGLGLGSGDLGWRDRAMQVDGRRRRAQVEALGPRLAHAVEGRRQHVLAGVLLHVVEAPRPVDVAVHLRADVERAVDDSAPAGRRRRRRRRRRARPPRTPTSCG